MTSTSSSSALHPRASSAAPDDGGARGGRAIGALLFSIFGGVWIAVAILTSLEQPLAALTGVGLITALLAAASIRVLLAHRSSLHKPQPGTPEAAAARWFNIINGVQWAAVFILVNVFNNLGHAEWIVPGIAAIVGLHFLPLATLFHYRPHAWTGLALLAIAIAEPLLAAPSVNHPLAAIGTGVVLWLSALRALQPATSQAAG